MTSSSDTSDSTIAMMVINAIMVVLLSLAALPTNSNRQITSTMVDEMVDIVLEEEEIMLNGQPSARPRKKRKRLRYDREGAKSDVFRDYVGPIPIFDDRQFERIFRITRTKFDYILQCLVQYEPSFWTQSYECTGRPGIAPEVKLLGALKKLCYGVSFIAFTDYFQMAESTARLCVSKLCRGIINCKDIADVYLRFPTKSDAKKMH